MAEGTSLFRSTPDASNPASYTAAQFHPDGFLLGCGTKAGAVEVWDARAGKWAVPSPLSCDAAVTAMAFSENGYHLATACETAVQVWDLRKLKCVHSVDFAGRGTPKGVAFDLGAQFMAVAADSVAVFAAKKWDALGELSGLPSKGATAVAFGAKAAKVFVGAADHKLRVYSAE